MEFLACRFLFVELIEWWFLFAKLVACWFCYSWHLCINVSPRETGVFYGTVECWFLFVELVVLWFLFVKLLACCFSLRETCKWIFFSSRNWFCSWNLLRPELCSWNVVRANILFMKFVARRFFSAWYLYINFSPRETDFANERCCTLNFVLGTILFILIFLFVNLQHWFFSSWHWFRSWKLLHSDFCSWNLLHADIVSMKSAWYLYIDFSSCETDFVFVACCVLIFALGSCCMLFLFVKIVARCFSLCETCAIFSPNETDFVHGYVLIFVLGICCVLVFITGNLLHVDFSLRETCALICLLVKLMLLMELFVRWSFVLGTFSVLIYVREIYCILVFLFVKFVHGFFSTWNWVFLIELSARWHVFLEVFASWFLFVNVVAC